MRRHRLGEGHPDTVETMKKLIKLYAAWGQARKGRGVAGKAAWKGRDRGVMTKAKKVATRQKIKSR